MDFSHYHTIIYFNWNLFSILKLVRTMKEPKKDLTALELFIGVFTYLMMGAGIITGLLFAWNFLVAVLG